MTVDKHFQPSSSLQISGTLGIKESGNGDIHVLQQILCISQEITIWPVRVFFDATTFLNDYFMVLDTLGYVLALRLQYKTV